MQYHYSQLLLKKMHLFDLRMLVLVKVATYFIANNYPLALVDAAVESDIYQLTIRTLIGTFMVKKVCSILVRYFRRKKGLRNPVGLPKPQKKAAETVVSG
jgi:hypothetical protein